MTIKEAKLEVIHTVKAYLKKNEKGEYKIPEIRQRPLLLMGPPGIGKTQIMEQVAAETGIGLVSYTITHHTRQTAVGLPFIKEEKFRDVTYQVTEYTMSEIIASIMRKIEEGYPEGILFIDEINCVSETLAPTMLQFLQCKTFGNQKIPSGWIIVSAGNPPEYNRSVREFDVVTLDRVRQISVEADYEVWNEYAVSQGIHRSIRGYLDLYPEHFYRMETDTDGRHFVTARGWEDLSHLIYMYEESGFDITEDVIYEYLPHHEVAEGFLLYLDLYHKYELEYDVRGILDGHVPGAVYERLLRAGFDERVIVVQLLLNALTGMFSEYIEQTSRIDTIQSGTDKSNDESREKCAAALSNAFSFMENAFPSGQEMVIFVNELTLSVDSVLFMAGSPDEKYLKYSKELMIGERRRKLLDEMDGDMKY